MILASGLHAIAVVVSLFVLSKQLQNNGNIFLK